MTQKTRRRLFILLVFAFFVIGTSAALYAQGYRVDIGDMSLEKVGGIYVRSFPRAAVYLDNKLIKEDFWFFQDGVLMNDLFPKKYEIRIVNDNYEEWRQTVEVEPSLVSEIKFAVLIPKVRTSIPSATSVQNFWIGEEGLIINSSGTLTWANNLLPGNKVVDEERESNRLLISDARKNSYVYNYSSRSSTSITAILDNLSLPHFSKISLDVGNQDVIMASETQIFILNIPNQRFFEITGSSTSTQEISKIAVSRDHLAWTKFDKVKNSSTLIIYNKDRRTRISYQNNFSGKTNQIEFRGDRLALLQSDGNFYMGNPLSASLEKIASDAVEFRFTDDNSRVAVRGKRILELFPLRNLDTEEYLKFELPEINRVEKMQWYKDGRHIFVYATDKTMFLDIDDEYLEHYYDLGKGLAEYDPATNQLYYLEQGSIKKIEFAE